MFGKVIKSSKDFMTVIPGSVLCYLTPSFSCWVKCFHFPALPSIINVVVTDVFWNMDILLHHLFLHSFASFFLGTSVFSTVRVLIMISCTKKHKPSQCKCFKGHHCHVLYLSLGQNTLYFSSEDVFVGQCFF